MPLPLWAPAFCEVTGRWTESPEWLFGELCDHLQLYFSDNLRIGDDRFETRRQSTIAVGMREMAGHVELNRDEIDLLAWKVANEVINGFAVENFSATVGTAPDTFKQLAKRLRSAGGEDAGITFTEASAFRNALVLTLNELGEDEFHTRTGHSFDEGNLILVRLNRLLGGQ